jgi:hypothetical protein
MHAPYTHRLSTGSLQHCISINAAAAAATAAAVRGHYSHCGIIPSALLLTPFKRLVVVQSFHTGRAALPWCNQVW